MFGRIDVSTFGFWRHPEAKPELTPTAESLIQAMEEVWRACMAVPAPDCIIVTPRFARVYRRAMRPPRRQIGGSGVRRIKRRAVRRPW